MQFALEKVSVTLGAWKMENFSIQIPQGSFVSIVGPSGCGKTTVLRLLAGLTKPDKGKIFFGSHDVTNIQAEERGVGFVFQGDALFPNLGVLGNVSFGLEMRKEEHVREKALHALKVVHLEGFENRKIDGLSGGERKRVAIARAIAFKPRLLLLDEPLNGLDANLREKMKVFLKEVQVRTGATVVMVTHDLDEAFPLSDLMVVMSNGRAEQAGTPEEIFENPKTPFVKSFTSDYVMLSANAKGKNAKFSLPLAKRGGKKVFVSLKKNNLRFSD